MSTEHGGVASRTPISTDLMQRLEAHDARLDLLIARIEKIERIGQRANAPSSSVEVVEEQPESVHESRFGVIVSVLVLVATLLTVCVAIFEYDADPNPASRRGLIASFRRELTSVVQVGELNAQQRAYADSMLNAELAKLIRKDLPNVPEAQRGDLLAEAEQATRAAGGGRVFFPQRYLNRDGSFDAQRQAGESWATAARNNDLNARAHFTEADHLRDYAADLTNLVFWLTLTLCIFELIGNVHPQRRVIRFASAAAAAICVVVVAALLGTHLAG